MEMGKERPDSPFQGEETYFDGSCSLCIGCKTLALFIIHPAMQCILRTVTMDLNLNQQGEIAFFGKF